MTRQMTMNRPTAGIQVRTVGACVPRASMNGFMTVSHSLEFHSRETSGGRASRPALPATNRSTSRLRGALRHEPHFHAAPVRVGGGCLARDDAGRVDVAL